MNGPGQTKNLLLGLLGALAGGALGHFASVWAFHQSFYAMMLPGGLAGLGGGVPARDKSVLRASLCAVFAVGLGFFTEWRCAPFIADHSLAYFATHLHQLRPITLFMVAAGGALGYWLSLGKEKSVFV
jgi:hypothetical protein